MKQWCWMVGGIGLVLIVAAGSALCARSGQDGGDGDFGMYIAPGTIAKSATCTWVTIHADVAYRAVEGVSAVVNGSDVDVAQTFADSCGRLVVKLRFDDVVALVDPPTATITLTVVVNGDACAADGTVRVKD